MAKRFTGWLAKFQAALQREVAAIEADERAMVELDIKRRMRDRKIGIRYARHRIRLNEELDKVGISEAEFCRSLGRGNSLATMQRRMKLGPRDAWDRYVTKRRARGDDGHFNLEYAVYLARNKAEDEDATTPRPSRSQSVSVTDDPDHELIHGDALEELRKRAAESIHGGVTSPPYWPARRLNVPDDPAQMGLERTLEEYLDRQKAVFTEVYRVLRNDATLWVLIDDAISEKPYRYSVQSHSTNQNPKKLIQTHIFTQDTTYLAPVGNWLDIPGHFASMMQSIGWHWRERIVWNKGASGRKESTQNRCRHNFEFILGFTKKMSGYWYDQDALRVPLAGDRPHTVLRGARRTKGWEGAGKRKDGLAKGYTTPGRHKDGTLRRDGDRDFRVWSNPLGRIHDAVWTIQPTGWRGIHSSSMPEELVRNCHF